MDRHAEGPRRNKAAIIWEGEPGDKRVITYGQLQREVCRFANVLEKKGVKSGDRVLIYMPMIPEAAIAMLACARIGAVHNVVFGGFAAEAIVDRLEDSGATTVITADGGWRRGKIVALKPVVDEALVKYKHVKRVIVVNRCGNEVEMEAKRDSWWHDEVADVSAKHTAKAFDSEHPLFVLYTSGSTGKPKGILHTSGGYLTGTYSTCKYIFDMRDEDVYWCTADVGWITGHSYIVYGPLANGVTQVMYEGAPNHPGLRPFLENDRGIRRHHLLHRAHRHPRLHQGGRSFPGGLRSFLAAPVRFGGRADQPGGLELVSQAHRRRQMPDRRYLVADRNRRDPDFPAARRDALQGGHRDAAVLRHRCRHPRRCRQGVQSRTRTAAW